MPGQANYIDPDKMRQVLEAIPRLKIRKWKDEDVVMLMQMCYWCDLRIMEAIPRLVEDFDLNRGVIYLGKTKNEKAAEAVIYPTFLPELRLWLKDKKGPLFPGLNYPTVYNWLKRLGKILDIKAWTESQTITGEKTVTHIFRKSMSKDLYYGTYGEKTPLTVISKHLRHKGRNPMDMTYHYLKLDTEDVKEVFDKQIKNQE